AAPPRGSHRTASRNAHRRCRSSGGGSPPIPSPPGTSDAACPVERSPAPAVGATREARGPAARSCNRQRVDPEVLAWSEGYEVVLDALISPLPLATRPRANRFHS